MLTDQWLNLTKTVRAGQLTATTNMTNSQGNYVEFRLTIGLVEGYQLPPAQDDIYIYIYIYIYIVYSEVFTIIQKLEEADDGQITEFLHYYCSLAVLFQNTEVRTWYS